MWLPFTRRTSCAARTGVARPTNSLTHGPGRIHHRARRDGGRGLRAAQHGAPAASLRRERLAAHARQHRGAARLRVERVQHHQARIVHPAVGVDKAAPVARLQRLPGDVRPEVDGGGGGEVGALGEVVVKEQARADHPRRPQVRGVRHDEVQRAHDVRGGGEQHFALPQRLAHQREVKLLEVAQPAVDQLGAGGGGV